MCEENVEFNVQKNLAYWCHQHQGAKQIQTVPDTFSLEVSSCEEKYFSQIQQKYGYPPTFNQR